MATKSTKQLRAALDAAIMGYVRKFEKVHDVKFDFAVKELYFYRKSCSENNYVYSRKRKLVQSCLG